MGNIFEWFKYERHWRIRIFNEKFGKTMQQVRRKYPIFIYDDYRVKGTKYKKIHNEIIKRKYGYLKTPLYHIQNPDDENNFFITSDKSIVKTFHNPFTEGDLIYFKDSHIAITYFDTVYRGYTRRLTNIPLYYMHEPEDVKTNLLIPAWVYYKNDNFKNSKYIQNGISTSVTKIIYLPDKSTKQKLHNTLTLTEQALIQAIRETDLDGDGALIDDINYHSGDLFTYLNDLDFLIEDMVVRGEIYYTGQNRDKLKIFE